MVGPATATTCCSSNNPAHVSFADALATTGPPPSSADVGGQNKHAAATSSTSSQVSFAFTSSSETTTTTAASSEVLATCSTQSDSGQNKTRHPAIGVQRPSKFTFSTNKHRFQVHSRHRSIWQLDELNIIKRPADSLVGVEQPRSSFGKQYKPQTLSHSYKIISELPDRSNERSANPVLNSEADKQLIGRSEQSSGHLDRLTMSQTLQSIHSLSMQLNRAASLSGSTHLDDLIDSASAHSPHRQEVTGASSTELGPSSKLTRLVGKKASRVKEILLQNLGKADKTTDELFKIYEENFYKQQTQAAKLQKEFKTYIQALKNSQDAGKSLNDFIQQSTGDYQSARHDLICENLSQLEHLNEDLMEKLRGQVLISVNEYLTQFKELRVKIAKRRRKLIDFDSSRRVYELALAAVNKKRIQQAANSGSQQAPSGGFRSSLFLSATGGSERQEGDNINSATSQLVNGARLLKLREQYNYCKIMYETINSELHEELPMVYEKEMKNLLMTLQNYFSLEAQFHSNAGKLFATSSDVIDDLPTMSSSSVHRNQHSHHSHHHLQHHHHHHHLTGDYSEVAASNKATSSGSTSGMGSSGADSSLESDGANSETNSGSPVGDSMVVVDPSGYDEHEKTELGAELGDEQVAPTGDEESSGEQAAVGLEKELELELEQEEPAVE